MAGMPSRLATILMLALIGCTNPVAKEALAPYSLSAEENEVIQASISRALKDPKSAQFRDFSAVRAANGSVYVCGLFNARNSFGGYTNFTLFEATLVPANKTVDVKIHSLGGEIPRRCKARGLTSYPGM